MVNFLVGLVVPIPTLPSAVIRIASVPLPVISFKKLLAAVVPTDMKLLLGSYLTSAPVGSPIVPNTIFCFLTLALPVPISDIPPATDDSITIVSASESGVYEPAVPSRTCNLPLGLVVPIPTLVPLS